MKHSLKDWIIATRPWSFPASAMPVLVTLGYLYYMGQDVDWIIGVSTLLDVVLFHAAGNTWSDYHDYKKGVDREDTVGGLSIVSGQFEAKEIRNLSMALFAFAVLGGFAILAFTGWPTLLFGLAGVLLTIMYPWMKYHALGDLDIFLTYAVLPMLGTSYVASGETDLALLVLALPVGLITVGILHSNNTRDIEQDERADIRTFAMNIGGKASVFLYCFEIVFPFVWCLCAIFIGCFPIWSLIVLVALVPALKNARQSLLYMKNGMHAMVGLDEKTAQLQLVFSLLLFVSFMLPALLG